MQGWIVYSGCSDENRDEIHESTILLRFLGIILRFFRLEVSTFVLPLYKMLFVFDCFVVISETIGVYGFLSGFPPVDAFLIVVSMGKRCIYI